MCSAGGSMWTTSSTSSTCTPRAATSVATSTRTSPSENAPRLRSRAPWDRLPCRSTAGMPAWLSFLAIFLARYLVRVNIMRRPVPEASASMRACLSSAWVTSTWWSMVVTAAWALSAECSTGSLRNFLTSTSTPLSSVAENSSRCEPCGVLERMRVTTGRKPMSAMWSASSSTVTRTSSSVSRPCLMRSSRRPGQATTMSTPLASAFSWCFWETPPKITVVFRPAALASGATVRSIWVASSRVGASTRPVGRFARRDTRLEPGARPARRETSGSANATVLPEPVRPRPSTSRPARESGRVFSWMGKASVMPTRARSEESASGTPRSSKE